MTESYYELLGVDPDASTQTIEAAYRDKLKETHPDVSDEEDASDRTKELIDAKEVLTDEDERARYDRLGHEQYCRLTDGASVEAADPDTASGSQSTTGQQSTTGRQSRQSGPTDGSSRTGRDDRTGRDTSAYWDSYTERSTGSSSRQQATAGESWHTEQNRSGDGRGSRSWRAWDTEGAYSLDKNKLRPTGVFASDQSFILLSTTFVLYPILLWGSLLPDFPLIVNMIMVGCLLGVVAYLQSIPTVGIVVFGVWSVLLPIFFLAFGIDPFSILAVAALMGAGLPLGLSVLTRAVIKV